MYTLLIFILLKNVFTMQRFLMLSFDHLSKSFMKFYSFYILASSVRLLRSVHNLFKKCICFQSKCLTSHLDVLAFKHTCTHTLSHTATPITPPLLYILKNLIGMCVCTKANICRLQYYKERILL